MKFTMILFLLLLTLSQISWATNKITPSHVYARIELCDRIASKILEQEELEPLERFNNFESHLGPLHVYQMQLSCISWLKNFELNRGLTVTPLLVATPMLYSPSDTYLVTDFLCQKLEQDAKDLGVLDVPTAMNNYSEKTPTDVFVKTMEVFMKIVVLNNLEKISPSEVYAQVVRARKDAQSIAKNIASQYDDIHRSRFYYAAAYGLDVNNEEHLNLDIKGKIPFDVFNKMLEIRHDINKVKEKLGMEMTTIPSHIDARKISPLEVFAQTQIIIAEFNLLKIATKTDTVTPMKIMEKGKTPSDVFFQGEYIHYILKKVQSHVK